MFSNYCLQKLSRLTNFTEIFAIQCVYVSPGNSTSCFPSSFPVSDSHLPLPITAFLRCISNIIVNVYLSCLGGALHFSHKHVSAVAGSCTYHAQAIRHIRHLLTTELAQTLACSLILSRIDYCNAVQCSTALPATASKSCSEYRTTQLGSFSKHQDDPTLARC